MKKFSLYLQLFFLLLVVIFVFLFMFVGKKYIYFLELFLGLGLIVLAYNTQKYYENTKSCIFYLIFGVLLLVMDLLMIIGD